MKKFQFKLAPVLDLRKKREEEFLRALGAAQIAYQRELSKKQALLKILEDSLLRRETLGNESIDINPFRLETDYIAGTKQRILRADQQIVKASRAVEKALRAYLLARRQTRAMETLYEKDFQEYKRAVQKREQKDQDDLMIMRQRMKEQFA